MAGGARGDLVLRRVCAPLKPSTLDGRMDRLALRDELFAKWREVWLLTTTTAVLEWDEDTAMPAAAAAHRSEQLALVAGLMHDRLVDPRLEELVHALDDANHGHDANNAKDGHNDVARLHARSIREIVARHHRLPRALVVD